MAHVSIDTIPRELWGAALPTSGSFRLGDRIKVIAPAPGGVAEYVCTTAGTVGRTAVFKAVSTVAD